MTKQKIALRRAHNRPQGLDPVERINAITRNARASWAGLVAVLLFVGVTLLGFEHIDFYGIDEQTTLPVVGVSVPTRFFFYAAPVLAAASYIYFHLYLLRLWSALATAPARIKGAPLSDATPVWLLLDAALWLRNLVRRDGSSGERALEGISALVNIALAWGFGLVVVGYAWWISATARDLWMTGLTALMWLAMIATAISSLGTLWRRVAHNRSPRPAYIATATFFLCAPLLAFPSYWRTTEPAPWLPRPGEKVADDWQSPYPLLDPFAHLAPIYLVGAEIVRKPEDWLPHDIQMDEFRVNYCKRKAITPCILEGDTQEAFDAEWQTRWQARLAALPKPKWHNPGHAKPDLRQANLTDSFLAGIDLNNAQMQGTELSRAQMQGANLRKAMMQDTDLGSAQMQGAVLLEAEMNDADLRKANMQGADLREAKMQVAILSEAQMQRADLRDAKMQGAILSEAQMQRADLREAKMQGVKLYYALLTGSAERPIISIDINLSASIGDGSALRFVDLSGAYFDTVTDWRNSFLDGTVTLPDGFRAAMGNPCQWVNEPLSDQQFYGRWRGWLETNDPNIGWSFTATAPPEWRDVTPIPPPEGCEWKFGLMPDAASK
ncbi:hypothetical protein ATO10_00770 [Actibacterium atlanticum]|uniref:Pentapeptide repeat-containing protein n=1 Tax=Actibacterium atlanticum TaxID=1461693 RepID=A0A058ZNU1_9RHOB|nr:pentapeptide repeat-containing protein [Actibacterium atlanticum]KCV83249.1 hypothetical protein ATO10_00770 [Actibacterium atlanticum]